jgi:cytochrome P450
MGVPEADWPQLKAWCGSRAALAWGRSAPGEQVEHATNMAAYRGYLRDLVASKVDDRADDYASVVDDPELIGGAVDETLRFDTSVPVWRRVTTRPVTLGGVDLPEGAKLFRWLALEGLTARWPGLGLVPDQEIPFHPNISFRGPLELWATA